MDLGNPLWFLEPKAPSARSNIVNRSDYNNNTTLAHLPQQKQRPVQQQQSPQPLQRQSQSLEQSLPQIQNTADPSSSSTHRPQTPGAPRFRPIVAAPQTKLCTSPVPLTKPEPICQINNSAKSENKLDRHGYVRAHQMSVAQSSLTLGESFNDTGSLDCLYDRNASDSDDGSCDVASVLSKASTKASSSQRSIKSGRCNKRDRLRQQHHNKKQQLSQQAEIRFNDKRDNEGRNRATVKRSDRESDQECAANETLTSPENSSGVVNGTNIAASTIVPRICRRRRFKKFTTYLPTLSLGLSTAFLLLSDRRSIASVLMAALHATRNIPYLF